MVITIEDDSQTLLELLGIRETWQMIYRPLSLTRHLSWANRSARGHRSSNGRMHGPTYGTQAFITPALRMTQEFSSSCKLLRSVRKNVLDFYTNSSGRRGGIASEPMRFPKTSSNGTTGCFGYVWNMLRDH
jgi:hypothetical protein